MSEQKYRPTNKSNNENAKVEENSRKKIIGKWRKLRCGMFLHTYTYTHTIIKASHMSTSVPKSCYCLDILGATVRVAVVALNGSCCCDCCCCHTFVVALHAIVHTTCELDFDCANTQCSVVRVGACLCVCLCMRVQG